MEGQSIAVVNKPEFEEEEHNCTNESKDASIGIDVKVNFEVRKGNGIKKKVS